MTVAELPPWQPPATETPTPAPSNGAVVDPDAPLITWHAARQIAQGQRRERSITTDADRIAPSSIDRRAADHVRVGQSYIRAFALLELPRKLRTGVIAPIARLPSADVSNSSPRVFSRTEISLAKIWSRKRDMISIPVRSPT